MLDTLRKAAQGWVAKFLLVLLVAAFGVWGISGSMFNSAGNAVVTVGETTVGPSEYRLAYNRQVATMSAQLQTRLTSEQAKAFGIPQRTFGALIAGAALDEQARKMNLGLSDDRLAKLVAEDPTFHDFNGRFDRNNFARILRSVGMSEEDYIASRSQVAVRTQIVEAVSDGFKAPDALLSAMARYQNETRDVSYILLTPSVLPAQPDPSDAELEAYFSANKSNYKLPEYRKISYVKLEPADIVDPAAIDPAAVKEDFEKNKEKYTTPETRTIDQLVFKDKAEAEAALAKLNAGTSFDDLAKEQGKTAQDIRIGTFTLNDAPSSAIGEAAFAPAAAGAFSDIVDGPFGPVILRVAEIKPAAGKTFEEVEGDLRKELALTEAYDQVLNVHDAFEDALAGGATLGEAAQKEKLKLVTIDAVSRAGTAPDGSVIRDIPESRDLLQGAFEAEANTELPPLSIGSDGFVWYQVDAITPERDRELSEVRDAVVKDLKDQKATDALGVKAKELADQIKEGADMAQIASDLGIAVETKTQLKRDAQDPVFGQAAVQAAFAGPEGLAGSVEDGAGANHIVFKVTAVNSGADAPDALAAETRDQISSTISDDLLDQLVSELRNEYGVRVNQQLADMAIAF